MGSSFNSKERQKKAAKKRKEKEERREERKAQKKDGNDLDEMIAYLDEDGNITSTPPDPTKKKKEIKAEDIDLGVPKREEGEPEDTTRRGTVTRFDESKGYGFIRDHDSQDSIFVHANDLEERIAEGDKVSFETAKGPKGLNAVNVKLEK